MSLELNKLTHAVDALGQAFAERAADFEQKLPQARRLLKLIGRADEALQAKVQVALRHRWAGAIPTDEPVEAAFPLPPLLPRVNVIAADGSQIYPDRHGVALYYLINIGSIVFRHGLAQAPSTRSQPKVYYEDAEIYAEGGGLIASVVIDAHRDIAELAELARAAAEEAPSAPTVALLDNGLLLYISLQAPNQRLVDEVLRDYLEQLQRVKDSGAAVAGIVDRPRAANVVRLLHLDLLELNEITEDRLRALGGLTHITDGALFGWLKPGERSALFENASPANRDNYKPRGHSIFFFYLNAGRPGKDAILRVELPEWVAGNRNLLDLVHAAIVEQCRIPDGFPYGLVRAHELAVVTVSERRDLEQMVAGALIRRGMRPSISQKAQGKVWTGAGTRRYP